MTSKLLKRQDKIISIYSILGEIEHSLSLSSPKLIFVSSFAADKVIACTNRSVTKNVILINRKTKDSYAYSLKDFLQQGAFDHGGGLLVENVDLENDVAFILNSSGTTGNIMILLSANTVCF